MDDAGGEGLERGSGHLQCRFVSPDHHGERPGFGARGAARKGRVEKAGPGRLDTLVLRPLDLGVDGRAVDDDLSGAERGSNAAHHLVDLG